jgi:DNA-binding LacI/PurR family transcriptional regulator
LANDNARHENVSKAICKMTATIKDVAAHAGFSIATVSRAINAPHTVNPLTLAKIQAAIAALKFQPNALGRQLRAEHTGLIGIVLPTLANPVFAETLQGIDEAAGAAGYRLVLMTTQYDAERERHALATLRAQRVDGVVMTVTDGNSNPLLDALEAANLPYVLAHNDTACRPSVSVNNRRAARDGVRVLIAQGHRQILMLAGSLTASDRARQRHLGYCDAMQEAGLEPRAAIEVDFNAEQLAPAVLARLSEDRDRPTALFCSNDLLAMRVMRDLRAVHLDVPHDMSILGFDGLSIGELLSPALASVCAPNREIGVQAWRQLQAQIEVRQPAAANVAEMLDTGVRPVRSGLTLPHSVRHGATIAPYGAAKAGPAMQSPSPVRASGTTGRA